MWAILGIIFYAVIAYMTCPRNEKGDFEEGAVALYIVIPIIFAAIYFICSD
ncbi:hypothetical protein [Bacteroides eggerthii]|jgi:cbb3-type cytochrome oxidase subunit 3|uniref:hypothetical protein n=1 Tax=Bacteroides eggerthii TaxID=28111 RepID=UPI0015FC66BD|nr:hypothetical protein [Bacteroides eggerthii]